LQVVFGGVGVALVLLPLLAPVRTYLRADPTPPLIIAGRP
jgi:hypothetical protein